MAKAKKGNGGIIKRWARRWFIDALGSMAMGLFATLIVGLILEQLAKIPGLDVLNQLATVAKSGPVVGAAIGVAVATGMKVKPLAVFSAAVVGAVGYSAGAEVLVAGTQATMTGGPLGAYLAALVGAEIGNLVAGRTKFDILLVPLSAIISGGLVGIVTGPYIGGAMAVMGTFINDMTVLQPLPMGIVISVVMGMILTAPISSAAIAIALGLEGLAAGAATAGCCAQMIGFAVASFRENGWGGLVAQGLGTSMLQVPNIVRRPLIWLPPTLASAITGPIATCLMGMTNNPAGAGMGTSGLVGQVSTWITMSPTMDPVLLTLNILLLHFILPAALTLLISEGMRKLGWIKFGDMKLELQ